MSEELLSPEELDDALKTTPLWAHYANKDAISRTYILPTFETAIKFVNAVAAIATELDHHPDIDIRWKKVRLQLSTHSANGLTAKDFEVARQADIAADGIPAD